MKASPTRSNEETKPASTEWSAQNCERLSIGQSERTMTTSPRPQKTVTPKDVRGDKLSLRTL